VIREIDMETTIMTRFIKHAKGYLFRLNNGIPLRRPSQDHQIPDGPLDPGEQETPEHRNRPGIHIVLFMITLATTTWAGATGTGEEPLAQYLASGLPYSLTLLAILLAHEFGHYFAARKFGVAATLPYFIPFPSLIGTMGAVIKTRSPIPDRRALLYIGAMGPLPGFALSLAAVIYGVHYSSIQMLPAPGGEFPVVVFGDSLLFKLIVSAIHGPIPPRYDIVLSPYAWAGWIGFLITGLNLMPIGQLDGAHVLYALIGRRQRIAGWAALACLTGLSFVWYGWVVWIALTLLILMVAHPFTPEGELSAREKVMGWLCMAVLALTFIPVPVEIF